MEEKANPKVGSNPATPVDSDRIVETLQTADLNRNSDPVGIEGTQFGPIQQVANKLGKDDSTRQAEIIHPAQVKTLFSNDLPEVPGYKVRGEIGKGGMGRVLAAYDIALDREVALKILRPGASASRFLREAAITARLPHPCIPPVHALGKLQDGSPFLAMKLIVGQTLEEEFKKSDRPQLLQALLQVCQAVGFAHSKDIIHRDLKPSNIMVGAFGEVQVMDWGLAKDLSKDGETNSLGESSSGEKTTLGAVMGTPAYMAPEQAIGSPADLRTDVFALGGLLCHILTGQPPFVGNSQRDVHRLAAAADLGGTIKRLESCGAEPELVALCRSCLSPNSEDRPADGQVVAQALATLRDQAEERVRKAELARAEALVREGEQRKRKRVLQWGGGVLVAVLLLGICGTAYGLFLANKARQGEKARADREEKAAEAERLAREEAQRRLEQIEKGVELFAGLLKGLNPRAEEQGLPPLYDQLRQRAAKAAEELVEDAVGDPEVVARLQTLLGETLLELGDAVKAVEVLERARKTRELLLGPDHPDTLNTLNTLAMACLDTGKLPEAIALLEQVRDAFLKKLGPNHLDTLTILDNLALAYRATGKLPEAIALHEQVREERIKILGPDHSDTLATMNNLAGAYLKEGTLPKAIALYEQARDTLLKKFGPNHPSTLTTLNNLAGAYQDTGRLPEAIALYEKVRDVKVKKLGLDHPSTIITLNNLARAFQDAGKLPDAIALLELAAAGIEKHHFQLDIASRIMPNTVRAYQANKQFDRAEAWQRKWLAVVKKQSGPTSQDYMANLEALGKNLLLQTKWPEAESILKESLAIREKIQPEDWTTFAGKSLLGEAMLGQKKFAEAEPLLLKGYEGLRQRQEKIPLPSKACLSESLSRLVQLYEVTGKSAEAAKWRKELESLQNAIKKQ